MSHIVLGLRQVLVLGHCQNLIYLIFALINQSI
jgi:hypothetical protein